MLITEGPTPAFYPYVRMHTSVPRRDSIGTRARRPRFSLMDVNRTPLGLRLRGELDAATAPQLETTVREALLESEGAFVLDLSDVTFMDSGGVNELLRARSLLGREERALALICPPGQVSDVLDTIGIADLFTRFETR